MSSSDGRNFLIYNMHNKSWIQLCDITAFRKGDFIGFIRKKMVLKFEIRILATV